MRVMKTREEVRRENGSELLNEESLQRLMSHYNGVMRLNHKAFTIHYDRAFLWDTTPLPYGVEFWRSAYRNRDNNIIQNPHNNELTDVYRVLSTLFYKDLAAALNPLMVDLSRYNTEDDE